MMEKRQIVVYQHRRMDTNEVFYVGIGLESRPYDTNSRNRHWNHIVNNTKYTIEILHTFTEWDTAAAIEIQLISEYGRRDLGTGTLVNMTDGGQGSLGRVAKPETLKKLSKLAKGRTLSKEWRHKMSESRTGLKRTDEQKINARYYQVCKVVEQYDLDGNFINSFFSMQEAVRQTNSIQSGIAMCCSGKRNTHNKYIWKYGN
jgi:hypothetical protein